MSKGKLLRKRQEKRKARAKVPDLFARAAAHEDQRLATRLIRRGRRLAMRFRMTLSPYKHQYCTHCYARLVPGKNVRVRIHGGKIVTYCAECRNYRRRPLRRKARVGSERRETEGRKKRGHHGHAHRREGAQAAGS